MSTKSILICAAAFLGGAYAQKEFNVCGRIANGYEAAKKYFSKDEAEDEEDIAEETDGNN